MMENSTVKRGFPLKDDQSPMNQPEGHKVGATMVMGRALVISPHNASPIHLYLLCFHFTVVQILAGVFAYTLG